MPAPRDRATEDPFAAIERRATTPPIERGAAPRWESVTALEGVGSASAGPFTISEGAVQWKARWRCQSGTLRMTLSPPPLRGGAFAEGSCPGQGDAFSLQTGELRLAVETAGPWDVTIDQQVTSALREPPLPEIASGAAGLLGKGEFFDVERATRGQAFAYRLPDGGVAVRLEGFETSANQDLFVWLSEAERPATSEQALDAPHIDLGPLKSTLGDHNYVAPAMEPGKARSVVIWCEPVRIAYGAASLAR